MVKGRKKYILTAAILLLAGLWWFSIPDRLFLDSYSTLLEDRSGMLIGATLADDGQWRFPPADSVPFKFEKALICFEDRRFYSHPGVDPLAIGRAIKQNIRDRRVVSGGSTLTMQVVRLSERGAPRTMWQKLKETWMATRLEASRSKEEILGLYASHAPFGGNVVGLEAAAWRYFGRSAGELSWSEAAALAVLPNSPSLVYPGKNEEIFRNKRDRLLHDLFKEGTIDSLTMTLARQEALPGTPRPLPALAPHLLTRALMEGKKWQRVRSTLDTRLQVQASDILQRYHERYRRTGVYNGAVLVLDVKTGKTLAYVGNTKATGSDHGGHVDIVTARRSTGSLLKPVLYASMLDEGQILPATLVPDIPTIIQGFAPQNFEKDYQGAVPADQALARSLNIPAVRLLQQYGVEKLHHRLGEAGMTTLNQSPMHYGLSLILGGAEGTLWDMAGMYASMARSLNNYFLLPEPNRYRKEDYHSAWYSYDDNVPKESNVADHGQFTAGALWLTFKAMQEVKRPESEQGWEYYTSSRPVAWKTGTSYGHRDAWAIGVTPEYVVGVWIGNADGEGRPGLTGVTMAAPVMFEVAGMLPPPSRFHIPNSDLRTIPVCKKSGYRKGLYCEASDSVQVTPAGLNTLPCTYHRQVWVTANEEYRAAGECAERYSMEAKNWFVLPAAQEWYYKRQHTDYRSLPPLLPGCNTLASGPSMELIYPKENASLYIPVELDGSKGATVFEIAHRRPNTTIFWHLDGEYIGQTAELHEMSLSPVAGKHALVLTDENGDHLEVSFSVQKQTQRQ